MGSSTAQVIVPRGRLRVSRVELEYLLHFVESKNIDGDWFSADDPFDTLSTRRSSERSRVPIKSSGFIQSGLVSELIFELRTGRHHASQNPW